MKTFIITEDEKNRILNLHIERTKNLYLTEQSVKDLTDKGFRLSNDGKYFSKDKTIGTQAGIVKLFRTSDRLYEFEYNGVVTQKGTWSWTDRGTVSYKKTPTPVTGDIREWAKCIKDTPDFKDIKNQNDENKVAQQDTSLKTWNVFYKDGTYEYLGEDGATISVGKWKCLPVVGLIIELDNGKKYFNKKWQGDADGIEIPSFDTIVEKGGIIIGKIGDKLVKWYNDTEKWIKDNSGGGSSNDNKPCTPLTDSEKKGDTFYDIRIPGDTKYIYGKDGNGNWYTKNTVNGKEFNLTKCGYTKAIKKLEKEGKKVSSPQKIEPNKVTSAPNDKVNIAYVPSTTEPKPEPKPLPNSDKVTDGQEEMSATTKL
jgi:hypothetical protein